MNIGVAYKVQNSRSNVVMIDIYNYINKSNIVVEDIIKNLLNANLVVCSVMVF